MTRVSPPAITTERPLFCALRLRNADEPHAKTIWPQRTGSSRRPGPYCSTPRAGAVGQGRPGEAGLSSMAMIALLIPTRGLADSLGLPESSRVRIDGGEG